MPFYSALARNYTAMDRYFCSILAPTFPNRIFLRAANTDRLTNSVDLTSLPTIWDRLAENGVSREYYFSNPNPAVPELTSPSSPSPHPCLEGLLEDLTADAEPRTPFRALANSPRAESWPVRRD